MLAVGRNFLLLSFHFDTCTAAVRKYTAAVFFFFGLVLISFMSFHCDTCTSAVVFFFVLCSQVLCVMLAVRPALSFQCDTCMHTHKLQCLSIPKR